MPQSVFAAETTQFIDGVDTDYGPPGVWNLGVEFMGSSKAMMRRCLAGWDVFGAAASGRALRITDNIVAAEMLLEATAFAGPAGWGVTADRIARADWDYLTADWTRYRIGSNWTAGGGDVATPPAAVGFSSPTAPGEQVVGGMLGFVTDAIAHRGGKVLLRLKADNEAPSQSQWAAYTAMLTASQRPRLRVTYIPADPAPISEPHAPSLRGERAASPPRADTPDAAARGERAEGAAAAARQARKV